MTFWASPMTAIPKSPPPDASRFCRPASADSDSNVRSASLLPHTGLRGPTLCPFCGCVAPKLLRVAWPNSKPDQPLLPRAYALPLQPVPTSPTQDGRVGPSGALSMTACGRPNATCLNLASGARAGSITVLALVQPVFATPSCCRPSRRPRRRCCVRSLGRALPHGSAPSPARPAPQYRQTACSSLCGGDWPLPVAQGRCGAHGPGCGAAVDVYGDHYAACPRTGLLARRAKPLERAWIRVVREALGPECQVVPQQWLVRTPAPGVDPDDRRRLDFVAYGATQLGEALCCDVTLVSPLARDGRPQPSSTTRDGAALAVAERRKRAAYPELLRRGPQRLCVLACETGGRWNDESLRLVAQLVRSRALRAPAPLRGAATQGWYRRWWGLLSVAVQNTLAATLLGTPPVHAPMPGAQAPHLQDVLHDACPPVPSCLPAR